MSRSACETECVVRTAARMHARLLVCLHVLFRSLYASKFKWTDLISRDRVYHAPWASLGADRGERTLFNKKIELAYIKKYELDVYCRNYLMVNSC